MGGGGLGVVGVKRLVGSLWLVWSNGGGGQVGGGGPRVVGVWG